MFPPVEIRRLRLLRYVKFGLALHPSRKQHISHPARAWQESCSRSAAYLPECEHHSGVEADLSVSENEQKYYALRSWPWKRYLPRSQTSMRCPCPWVVSSMLLPLGSDYPHASLHRPGMRCPLPCICKCLSEPDFYPHSPRYVR